MRSCRMTRNLDMDDEAPVYRGLEAEYLRPDAVKHGEKEYVRYFADDVITTNTIEGYFWILKRGITGTYHHGSQKHLKRYLAEFDFRYNNRSKLGIEDGERAMRALMGIEGKRLTYRPTDKAIS